MGWLLRIPLACVPSCALVWVLGGINRGYRWIAGSGPHGCWLGSYEQDKQSAIGRRVAPGSVAFDVGANVGFYTLALARLAGPGGRVYSFEPDAANVAKLRRHVEINRLENVSVLQVAVADKQEMVCFRVGENSSTGRIDSGGTEYLVAAMPLDRLIAAGCCQVPDVIKMDVEGAEALVLDGARAILAARKTVWFIALHGDQAKKDCFAILGEYGYTCETLDGETIGDDFIGDEIVASPGTAE